MPLPGMGFVVPHALGAITIDGANTVHSFDNTDATSYATASITPTAGSCVVIATGCTRAASIQAASTPTGTSIDTVSLITSDLGDSLASPTYAVTVYVARGTGSAGAITLPQPQTMTGCAWQVVTFAGVNRSVGTGGVVQSTVIHSDAAGSANAVMTFATFASTSNAGFAAVGLNGTATISSVSSGWTDNTLAQGTAPNNAFDAQYKLSSVGTGFSTTFSAASRHMAVGIELSCA